VWRPDHLSVIADALTAAPNVGLVVTDVAQINESGDLGAADPIAGRFPSSRHEPYLRMNAYSLLLDRCFIWTMSQVACPRVVLESIGESDRRFPIASDYDLYLRIAKRFDVVLVGRQSTLWRQVEGSASGRGRQRRLNWYRDRIRVLAKHRASANTCDRAALSAACDRVMAEACEFIRYELEPESRGAAMRRLASLAVEVRTPAPLAWAFRKACDAVERRMHRAGH
jgi:hypothetical protein